MTTAATRTHSFNDIYIETCRRILCFFPEGNDKLRNFQ